MSPAGQELPRETVDVVIGGFGSSAAGYAELLDEMRGSTGNRTVFVGMTRWGLLVFRRRGAYPRVLYRQALHIVRTLERQGITRVRLYGHSMAGAVVLIIADAFSDRLTIEQVAALNPACLHVDGVLPLLRRMIRKGRLDAYNLKHHTNEQVRRIVAAGKPGALRYVFSNPGRSLVEGIVLSRTRLFAALYPRLCRGSAPIVVAYSDDDIVFEPDRLLEVLNGFPDVKVVRLEGVPHDVQYFPSKTVAALRRHGAL